MFKVRLIFGILTAGIIFLFCFGKSPAQTLVGSCNLAFGRNIGMSKNPNFVFISRSDHSIASIDISDPANPLPADTLGFSYGEFTHIFIRDNSAYLTGVTHLLQIVNIVDPHNMTLISSWDPGHDILWLHCSYVRGNIAYLTSCFCVFTLNVADETNPVLLHEDCRCGDGYGICADENYMYIDDIFRGFQIFDITSPADPVLLTTTPICEFWSNFSLVRGQYVYLSTQGDGLYTINATDVYNPVIADIIGSNHQSYNSTFNVNNYLFVATSSDFPQCGGFYIYDISDPANPTQIGYYAGSYYGVYATEQYIYLVDNSQFIILSFDATDVTEETSEVPKDLNLFSAYPNPFNPATTISFTLSSAQKARLEIFDILGRKVKMLADRKFEAGEHSIVWDGTDQNGFDASSGVYFYRLSTDGGQTTRKMLLLR